jgi:DNA polymerase III subunit epsilon
MTRRIVLDTETTGLEPEAGHRIIEVACIELADRRQTGRHFHRYVNPEREVDVAATEVHGLKLEDLADRPRFADIADEFLDFVSGAELLIHNAEFDLAFLNAELGRMGKPRLESVCTIADTLALAREMTPGKKNSLDALCERYGVDNTRRTIHGALLDAQLLADCWVAMTRGQETLDILMAESGAPSVPVGQPGTRPAIRVLRATVEELAAHAALCERLAKAAGGRCVWNEPAPA